MLMPSAARGDYEFTAGGRLFAGAGSSEFAPYYLNSGKHGRLTQSDNVLLDLYACDSLSLSRRFDFAWGVEALGGYESKADYMRYHEDKGWTLNPQKPASVWLQQLYAEVKWRCLYLSVGMKDKGSVFVDNRLSSGDLIWSGNTRGIPEVRIGFVDFQTIPWLKGWVQADPCIGYGKMMDADWINNHYNYYSGMRHPGNYWTYKRIYLRSNPEKNFMFQLGFQMTGMFGGTSFYYDKGVEQTSRRVSQGAGIRDFFDMLLPLDNGKEGYINGDHKGSWDIAARYRFDGGHTLRAYTQWFWEDGTSLLKKNGWDGLWGIEYRHSGRWWINGAAVEYLDLTNQSGPLHWDPTQTADGERLTGQVRGNDWYYNNGFHGPYSYYGQTIGTPAVMGNIFNVDGSGWLDYTRVRGVHVAVEGSLGRYVDWIVKYGHRKAWGRTNNYRLVRPAEADNWMIGASWHVANVPGLSVSGAFGADTGSLPGKAFGVLFSVSYDKIIRFKRK